MRHLLDGLFIVWEEKLNRSCRSLEETHESLTEYSLTSTNGEKMIYVNDGSSGIIVFTTNSNMRYICQIESDVDIFCDRTFKYCPRFCYQFYTILGFKNGQCIPCIFFLLPSKSKPVYLKMFQFLIDSCKENGFTLSIFSLHIDFEEAAIDAAKSTWPDVIIKRWYFHISQASWRKILNVGLANEYKDPESVIGKWLKVFFGHSFLKDEEIEDAIAFDIFSSLPEDEQEWVLETMFLKTMHNRMLDFHLRFGRMMIWTWKEQIMDVRHSTGSLAICFTTSLQTFFILWTNLSTYRPITTWRLGHRAGHK